MSTADACRGGRVCTLPRYWYCDCLRRQCSEPHQRTSCSIPDFQARSAWSLGLGEDSPAVLQTPCHAYRTLVLHSLLSSPLLFASAVWVVAAGGAAAGRAAAADGGSIMVVRPGCPGCALRHHGSVVGMSGHPVVPSRSSLQAGSASGESHGDGALGRRSSR
jgi:hypothetical protein